MAVKFIEQTLWQPQFQTCDWSEMCKLLLGYHVLWNRVLLEVIRKYIKVSW